MLRARWRTYMTGAALLAGMASSGCPSIHWDTSWPERRPLGAGYETFQPRHLPEPGDPDPPFQEPTGTVRLQQVVGYALLRNPRLSAFSWDVRAHEARTLQAGLMPNPEISFRAEDVFGTGPFHDTHFAETTIQLGQLVELGVRIVPTLILHETWAHLLDRSFTEQLDLSGVPDSIQGAWNVPGLVRRAGITSANFQAFRRSRFAQDRFVRMYHRAGGTVAAGSDAPNQLLAPGASLHDEMAMLVRAGLLPRDALLAATRNVAALLEADSIGVIRAGGVADFVVLDANPLEDIQNTKRINRVVVRGTAYLPEDFKEGWQ